MDKHWDSFLSHCIPIFTFLLLSIHCWSTSTHPATATSHMSLHAHLHTTLTFAPLDQLCLADGQMIYNLHVTFPFLVTSHPPPMAQPITSHHTTWSGTCYSFASDELCAWFLAYHSYITCLYLPYHPRLPEYKFPPEFRFNVFASPCPISYLETIPYPLYRTLRASLGLCLDCLVHQS